MKGFSELKSGKVLRVNIEYDDRLKSVELSGDFFIHPEEAVEALENHLKGTRISDFNLISSILSEKIIKDQIQLVGISPDDIQLALLEAVK